MKKVILEDLKVRYTGEKLELLTKATLLDSRFKNLKFLVEYDCKLAIDDLKMDFYLVHGMKRRTPDEPKRPKGQHKLLEFIGEIMKSTLEQETFME